MLLLVMIGAQLLKDGLGLRWYGLLAPDLRLVGKQDTADRLMLSSCVGERLDGTWP